MRNQINHLVGLQGKADGQLGRAERRDDGGAVLGVQGGVEHELRV